MLIFFLNLNSEFSLFLFISNLFSVESECRDLVLTPGNTLCDFNLKSFCKSDIVICGAGDISTVWKINCLSAA